MKWCMKLASSKYKARSLRNTKSSHTKTISGSKLTSVRKETSESLSLLKTPAHCLMVINEVKRSFRNDQRMKREWKSDHFWGTPASNTGCSSAYTKEDVEESVKIQKRWLRNAQRFPQVGRLTTVVFCSVTSMEKGCERGPDNSWAAWRCEQESITCHIYCHKRKAAQLNVLGWRSNTKKRKYFFHTMQNWIMALVVTGCCEGQNYKRIPKGASQILGGSTHLQLLNTMTQMPVKNSLNRSLLSTELVIPRRDCAMLALSLHPFPKSLLLKWATWLAGPLVWATIAAQDIIYYIRYKLRNWILLQAMIKFVHLTWMSCLWQALLSDALGERHFCPKILSIMPLAVCTKDQLFPDLPQMLC